MLKRLACFLFLPILPLYALSITINVGKENGEEYAVAHVTELESFSCEKHRDDYGQVSEAVCVLPRQPQQNFEPIHSNFFTIDASVKNKKYFVRIVPKLKMQLFAIEQPLYENSRLYGLDMRNKAKHWVLVGYKEKLPMINPMKSNDDGINFPLEMANSTLPSIGALDIAGRPIKLDKIKDVSEYMRIKSAYEAGNLEDLSKDVTAILTQYPKTIFKAELLLYKIRGLHYQDENEELLNVSKEYMRHYSDDPNMPEILAYTANAYSHVGLQADGSYFYERLFAEFPESKYAALGKIYLGDQFLGSGKIQAAKNYYENALYQTRDVEIASMAAIRLARMSLEQGDLERARDLYAKVIEGNKKYLLHDIDSNYENARMFANRKFQKIAAAILQGMLDNIDKGDDRCEEMQRDVGVWLSETDDKAGAYTALNTYLTTYGESTYTNEVQKQLDGLFYVPEDANKSALISEYEALEGKYESTQIGQKAALEKARLLYETGHYEEVLKMTDTPAAKEPEFAQIKTDAARALAMRYLDENACGQAMTLSKEHNLTLDSTMDAKVYECAYQTGNYTRANETAQAHIKDREDRLLWLYRYAKTLDKIGNYDLMTKVGQDVLTMADADKTDRYDDIIHDMFKAYEHLGDEQGMILTAKALENRKGLNYDDIEIYVAMVQLGIKQKDEIMTLSYAKKVMELQEKTKSYSQTPFVEFAALQVYKNQKDDAAQKQLLESLIKHDLKPKERARAFYMWGSLLMKEGKAEEAKSAFDESIKAQEDSAWAGLSKDALKLME